MTDYTVHSLLWFIFGETTYLALKALEQEFIGAHIMIVCMFMGLIVMALPELEQELNNFKELFLGGKKDE